MPHSHFYTQGPQEVQEWECVPQYIFCDCGSGLVTKSCSTLSEPTVAHQAPLSMRFSRQEYRTGLLFSSPGDLPDPGMHYSCSSLQVISCIAREFFSTELSGKSHPVTVHRYFFFVYTFNCMFLSTLMVHPFAFTKHGSQNHFWRATVFHMLSCFYLIVYS